MKGKTTTKLALVLGASAVLIQTGMLRQIMAVYGFNEVIISAIFFVWLAWGAVGSITFRRGKFPTQITLLGLSGLITPALIKLSAVVLHPTFGTAAPVWTVVITAAIGAMPAFFGGRTFASLAKLAPAGKLYASEGIGSFIGGILTLLLLPVSDNMVFLASALLIAFAIANNPGAVKKYILWVILLAGAGMWGGKFAEKTIWKHYDFSTVDSPYGKIVLLTRQGESYLYQNGKLIAAGGDTLSTEQIIHPVMWVHDTGATVLLVGGIFNGAGGHILKHSPARIDFPYTDRKLYLMAIANFPHIRKIWNSPKFHPVYRDVRTFLRATREKYDIIFALPGMPLSGGDNRFWTREFFRQLRSHLTDTGAVAVGIPVGANFLSPYQAELCAGIWRTFSSVFATPEIYFLDGMVLLYAEKSPNRGQSLKDRLIALGRENKLRPINAATIYPEYLPILFQSQRQETLMREISAARFSAINRDWHPLIYIWGVLEQIYLSGTKISPELFAKVAGYNGVVLGIVAIVAIIFALIGGKIRNLSLTFIGGLWGILSQTLFMLIFQANFGNLYWLIGADTGVFLLGTSLGSYRGSTRKYAGIEGIGALAAIGLVAGLGIAGHFVPIWGFFAVFFLAGVICGLSFGIASAGNHHGNILYAADLTGSAVGTALALYLIPTMSPGHLLLYLGGTISIILALATARRLKSHG